jgi:hypothetical protein
MILRLPSFVTALLCLGLSACLAPEDDAPGPLAAPPMIAPERDACLARVTTPAAFETVTDQVMIQPPALDSDGTLRDPAVYRTVTRQRIVRERRAVEFATPCPEVMTPAFIASVQRALKARGYYRGPVTGALDTRTGQAIQRYQRDRDDVDTATLSLRSARDLGLVAVPREAAQ